MSISNTAFYLENLCTHSLTQRWDKLFGPNNSSDAPDEAPNRVRDITYPRHREKVRMKSNGGRTIPAVSNTLSVQPPTHKNGMEDFVFDFTNVLTSHLGPATALQSNKKHERQVRRGRECKTRNSEKGVFLMPTVQPPSRPRLQASMPTFPSAEGYTGLDTLMPSGGTPEEHGGFVTLPKELADTESVSTLTTSQGRTRSTTRERDVNE